MSAFTKFRQYSEVLIDEMKSFFFIALVLFVVITSYFDFYLHLDGSIFSLQTFFEATLPNYYDFSRIVSIGGTHAFSFLYVLFQGDSYWVTAVLFKIGLVAHAFFPFFLLVYQRYRNPEARKFVQDSFAIYVCSLLVYRTFCNIFVISELHFAHSVIWMVLIAYRYNMMFTIASSFNRNVIWTFSILGIFAYPLTLFTFPAIFTVQFLNSENIPRRHGQDWRPFFIVMWILNAVFLVYYLYLFTNPVPILMDLKVLYRNEYAKLSIAAFVLFMVLRPVFKYQNYFFLLLCVPIYFQMQERFPYWSMGVRTYGAVTIVLFQIYYLFFYRRDSGMISFTRKARPYCLFILAVFFFQGKQMTAHQDRIIKILRSRKGNISYEEVKNILPKPLTFYHNEWNIRNFSVALQLKRDNRIHSIIDPHPERLGGMLHNWGTENFHKNLKARKIDFDPSVTINRFDQAAQP